MSRRTYNLILILVVLAAVSCVALTFSQVRFFSRADEGCYLRYATLTAEQGLAGLNTIFKGYIEDEPHWFNPNPLRIGFTFLSATWLKLFGYTFINLAYLSLLSYILFLFLSYYFARKYLGEQFALLLVILLSFSPLQMAMARRALTDSTVNLFTVASIWLFWDLLSNRSRLKSVLFIAVYTCSILIKETAVLLVPVFLLYYLFDSFKHKRSPLFKEIAPHLLIPLGLAAIVYLGCGCMPYMFDTLKIVLAPPKPGAYAVLFCSGPWYRYLIDYLLLSPWVVILSIGFIFTYFMRREDHALSLYFIFVFFGVFILFDIFMKNVRYVIILDTPMRLFSLLMLNAIAQRFYPRQAMKLTVLAVLAIAFFDCTAFYDLFIREAIYDPASFFLLKARQIIPF